MTVEYCPPRPDQLRVYAAYAGASIIAGIALFVLRAFTGIDIGGPALVLVCVGCAYFAGAYLAAVVHRRSHFTRVLDGTMAPRTVSVGIAAAKKMWVATIDGSAPLCVVPTGVDIAHVMVDGANLCMMAPRDLRRQPCLHGVTHQILCRGSVATTADALSLFAEATRIHQSHAR